MDQNERQIIDELFGKLRQAEARSGPRDPQAESHIQEQVARQPVAPYLMAQAIVIQEQALAASQARIEELEQQAQEQPRSASGGLFGGLFGGGASNASANARPSASRQANIGDPRVAAYSNPNQQQAGGGFLAGAMQTAMGVAGGMLIGSALASAFSGDAAAEEPAAEEPMPEEMAAEEDSFFGGEDEEL